VLWVFMLVGLLALQHYLDSIFITHVVQLLFWHKHTPVPAVMLVGGCSVVSALIS
jgi:hypothetical protein